MQDQNFQPMPWAIKYIAGFLVAIELLLWASDSGLLPDGSLRQGAYLHGAVWPVLLWHGWEPVYPGQSVAMLLTHGFLHSGLLHMAMNTVVILGLGKRLELALSNPQLILVFCGSVVAGALVFVALDHGEIPMVGASGAVFGFFGAWKYFEFWARRRAGLSLLPIWQFIGAMVLLNVALNYLVGGMLAWEAHLGGFIAGWLLTMAFTHRGRQARRGPPR